MLDPVSNKVSFPRMETEILAFWREKDVFRQSVEQRDESDRFIFYDGPPFATGLPHYGHIVPGTIKDIVPRYQTMRGKRVERRFGWDCHGLPVENEVEKQLGISGKKQIEGYGVDKFNETCRSIVLRYTSEWERIIGRTGRWIDFENDYKTMDLSYMESIWQVFRRIWDKGLIYEGNKSMPFCPRCSTPLSNFEVQLAYKEVKDPAVTVKFAVDGEADTFLLAWTTTPWTLPSNLALTVGPDIDYVTVTHDGAKYILASDCVETVFQNLEHEVGGSVKGRDLVGKTYEPLFADFAALKSEGAFKVLAGDFVATDEGTGIVHTAPGFGEDDFEIGKQNGVPMVCPMDMEGQFTEEVADYAGRYAKDVDQEIVRRLKDEGKLLRKTTIEHNYPHCWRCDTPLFYRAITTWFLSVGPIKEQMIAANRATNWVPSHLRDGRFGNWIANARDWAISRNRYWGAPLPVWKCESEECDERVCIGSLDELEEKSGQRPSDLHKHIVDPITFPCAKCDGTMHRITEVLDCWFESGSMPYAQSHWPFENEETFDQRFPPTSSRKDSTRRAAGSTRSRFSAPRSSAGHRSKTWSFTAWCSLKTARR